MKPRIMYIESKGEGLNGAARIGRVTFSKSGRTIYYRGRSFYRIDGGGFKSNISMRRPAITIGFPGRARTARIVSM